MESKLALHIKTAIFGATVVTCMSLPRKIKTSLRVRTDVCAHVLNGVKNAKCLTFLQSLDHVLGGMLVGNSNVLLWDWEQWTPHLNLRSVLLLNFLCQPWGVWTHQIISETLLVWRVSHPSIGCADERRFQGYFRLP